MTARTMTTREWNAVRTLAIWLQSLCLRTDEERDACRRRKGKEAWFRGDARPDCSVEAAGWDDAAAYMAHVGAGAVA